jgi:UDP-glucose 6-dehydrogenase
LIKRPSTHKQRREKRRFDEIEQNTLDDLSTDVSSSNCDPFDPEFCRQQKAAIDNMEYRRIIISWKAKSLNEIIGLINSLSIGKNSIDRAWIVFYWISQNIEFILQ